MSFLAGTGVEERDTVYVLGLKCDPVFDPRRSHLLRGALIQGYNVRLIQG